MDETLATPVDGITRRSAVTKIAVGTAVVWAAPALTTLGSRASAGSNPPPVPFSQRYDFEGDEGRTAIGTGTVLSSFVVAGGNIDVLTKVPDFYGSLVQEGNSAGDLDGTASPTAMLTGTTAVPAGNYTVSVRVGGSGRPGQHYGGDESPDTANTITVSLGNASTSATLQATDPVTTLTFLTTVTGAADTTLIVTHQSPDGPSVGNLLYYIQVDAV